MTWQGNFDLSVVLLEFLNLSALSHHDETKSFGIDFYYYFMSPYHLLFPRLPLKKLFAVLELLLTAHQSSNSQIVSVSTKGCGVNWCCCCCCCIWDGGKGQCVGRVSVEASSWATFEEQAAWRGCPIVVTCSQHLTSVLCLISWWDYETMVGSLMQVSVEDDLVILQRQHCAALVQVFGGHAFHVLQRTQPLNWDRATVSY